MFQKIHIGRMLRNLGSRMLALSFVLFFVSSALSQISADKIFPDSTKGFVSIRNLKDFGDQWKKTQIGILLNESIMQPFKDDLRAQLTQRFEDRFGLSLDGIESLPSGEIAFGMIAIPDKKPGYMLTMDVTDRLDKVEDYIKRLEEKLVKNGVVKETVTYKDQKISVFSFPDRLQAETRENKDKSGAPKMLDRKAHLMLKNNHLLISDQCELVQLIADRIEGKTEKSLSDLASYQTVMKRCLDDLAKESDPILRWYIEPLNYGESIRALLKGPIVEKRRSKPSIFSILKDQGFDAIKGVGGIVSLKTEGKEVIYRTFVYTEKPYRLAMRMLVFPDGTNFAPPAWMPKDLARCTILYVDPTAIFDNFGTLFDSLVMQGEEGVWRDILAGIKEDENGPQVDIREELIVHLGQRVLSMSHYTLPITPQSENMVFAVELKEGKDKIVAKTLQKLFGNDSEMQLKTYKSYQLWMRIPAEDVIQPFDNPAGVPDLVQTTPNKKGKTNRAKGEKEEDEDEKPPMFPNGAITVANGCLFASTNFDYLTSILDRIDAQTEKIADHPEYKQVDMVFANMGLTDKPHFIQFFAKTDETFRPTYDLIRQGKMPQSQALLGKLANRLFTQENETNKEGIFRKQNIDGSKLPEFSQIQHYFGPSGLYGTTEEKGYFIKGFLVQKEDEKKAETNKEVKPAEKSEAEKPAMEKPVVEKPVAEKPADGKPAVEKPIAEKPIDEKPAVNKPAAEKPADEKPIAEKPAAEKTATENPLRKN